MIVGVSLIAWSWKHRRARPTVNDDDPQRVRAPSEAAEIDHLLRSESAPDASTRRASRTDRSKSRLRWVVALNAVVWAAAGLSALLYALVGATETPAAQPRDHPSLLWTLPGNAPYRERVTLYVPSCDRPVDTIVAVEPLQPERLPSGPATVGLALSFNPARRDIARLRIYAVSQPGDFVLPVLGLVEPSPPLPKPVPYQNDPHRRSNVVRYLIAEVDLRATPYLFARFDNAWLSPRLGRGSCWVSLPALTGANDAVAAQGGGAGDASGPRRADVSLYEDLLGKQRSFLRRPCCFSADTDERDPAVMDMRSGRRIQLRCGGGMDETRI